METEHQTRLRSIHAQMERLRQQEQHLHQVRGFLYIFTVCVKVWVGGLIFGIGKGGLKNKRTASNFCQNVV